MTTNATARRPFLGWAAAIPHVRQDAILTCIAMHERISLRQTQLGWADMGIALVTGASRGLGAAMAKGLAAADWSVAVNYAHDKAGAEAVVAAIQDAGGRAQAARFDVTDESAIRRGLDELANTFGPVDLVVNNATGPQPFAKIEDLTWEHHLDQLRFFVKAPLHLLQALLPEWRRRKVGRIINIGSECFELGNPEFGHYVAAKGAMLGLTRSWARELGPDGINVNLVEPGWIPVERHATSDPAMLEEYRTHVALGRLGKPVDAVGIVVFLASTQADFITGQAIAVNGGRTLS